MTTCSSKRRTPSRPSKGGPRATVIPQRLRETTSTDPVGEGHRRGRPHHRAPRPPAGRDIVEGLVESTPGRSWRTTSSTPRPARCSPRREADLATPRPVGAGRGRHQHPSISTFDLDRGPISTRCASIRPRTRLEALVEIYRMMRPGEPPDGRRREPVPEPVLQRRTLRPVAGRPHEVQPPSG